MSRGEPRAKRRRLPAVEPDYLAALPPEIVDGIISRLDIRDVVRTFALSRAWRRRWEYVRGLDLSFRSSDPPAAISSVLKRSAAPVGKVGFRFHRAVRWLRLLPRKRVQSLDLDFEFVFGDKPKLDPSSFSCQDLTSLCLDGCILPQPPPSFLGFLKLTMLSLFEIDLPRHGERQLEAMIAASPLLVDLSLSNVRGIHRWKRWFIRGPNLRSVWISIDDDNGCRIGELPRLEDAAILAGPHGNPPERFPFTFQNLRSLDLHACLDQISSTSWVFCILRCAPNLETLEIEVERDDDEVDAGSVEGFANAQTSNDIFPRLRDV